MSRLPLKFQRGDGDYFFGVAVGVILGTAVGLTGLICLALVIMLTGLWWHYHSSDDAD